jgi:hypothetical protein
MSIIKKLSNLFSSPPKTNAYGVTVKCSRCDELIQTRINLQNDLSVDFESGGKPTYYCRKVLMGEGYCFQRVEIELIFDANKHLVNREISGGQFIDDNE